MWASSSSWNGRASDASLTMSAIIIVTTVFPLLAHAMWAPYGWLMKHGGIDAMGVSIVHVSGGIIGIIGCFVMGPRSGRFDADGSLIPKPPFSARNLGLGTLIVVLSYFSRCVFSLLLVVDISGGISDPGSLLFKSIANVILSMLGTWVCVVAIKQIPFCMQRLQRLRGGSLLRFLVFRSGFLAVGAAPHMFDSWSACASGIVSGVILCVGDMSLSFRIDDSLGVASVDFLNGMWGMLSVGFFASGLRVCPMDEERLGLLLGGGWTLLWNQTLVCSATVLLGSFSAWICFRWIVPALGGARLTIEEEFMGVDQDGLFHRLLRRGKRRKAVSKKGGHRWILESKQK
jgi:ammonium transporter, Amt family